VGQGVGALMAELNKPAGSRTRGNLTQTLTDLHQLLAGGKRILGTTWEGAEEVATAVEALGRLDPEG
jgi:hypothetical protein